MVKKHKFEPEPHETVIAAGVELKGNLTSDQDIWLDGTIAGHISSQANITIGPNATVLGNVKGINVVIGGSIEGNVRAAQQLVIQETARISGDLFAATLAVNAGSKINGNLTMPQAKAREKAAQENE